MWWNWRNIFAINKVQTSKGLQSDQFCSLFLWYTIWTWKNICHALWSWKSVSLIISLDGLVWTWHNYKYLSIQYNCGMYYVPFYHPNCQICNQSLIEKSLSNFQKLLQESNLGPLPENKVDLGSPLHHFQVVDPRMHHNFNDAGIRYFKYNYVSFIPYFHILVFGILVTLVAWFSFCFFCLAHLALQNVNKDYLCNIFVTSLPKVTKSQKRIMGWMKH